MENNQGSSRNWFDQGGSAYAKFRPEYPLELSHYLSTLVEPTNLAVDVGCGSGQLTTQLATYFNEVIGLDPSREQIDNAVPVKNIKYECAPAEKLPAPDRCANLITAAQSAHWFDFPAFYSEVRRIATPNSVLALISYGVMNLDPEVNDRFQKFYWDDIGAYWPPRRKLVDNEYREIIFPFNEFKAPAMSINRSWNFEQLLGYFSTWSAVLLAKEAGKQALLDNFANDLKELWGDPSKERPIEWPINMRIGTI